MPQDPQSLGRQFTSVTKWFSEFGARLSEVAEHLRSPGIPPSEELIVQLQQARREFEDLRAGVLELAASLSITLAKPPDAVDLPGMSGPRRGRRPMPASIVESAEAEAGSSCPHERF